MESGSWEEGLWAISRCKSRPFIFRFLLYLPPATKLGQGYIFTGVCDAVHGGVGGGGCLLQEGKSLLPRGVVSAPGGCLLPAGSPGSHTMGNLREIRSRPTPKGEIEGDQVQAHSKGGS